MEPRSTQQVPDALASVDKALGHGRHTDLVDVLAPGERSGDRDQLEAVSRDGPAEPLDRTDAGLPVKRVSA